MSEEANAYDAADPVELWKNWNETTTKMGSSILDGEGEVYGTLSDFYSLWMTSGALFKLWYNATYGAWVRIVGDMLCLSLLLPSRTDMAHVAKHMVALEERVYMIEDAFVTFEGGSLEATTDHQMVQGQMSRLEGKLNIVDGLSTIPPHATTIGDLAGRLERVEGKLDRLLHVWERIEASLDAQSAWSDKGGKGITQEEA